MTDYNDGKWHGWNGGECPVHPETVVEYVTAVNGPVRRESVYSQCAAGRLSWEKDGEGWVVVAFRVIKEHREPRELWTFGSVMFGTEAEAAQHLDNLRHEYPARFQTTQITRWREVLE